jgi:hypothetical protein
MGVRGKGSIDDHPAHLVRFELIGSVFQPAAVMKFYNKLPLLGQCLQEGFRTAAPGTESPQAVVRIGLICPQPLMTSRNSCISLVHCAVDARG